MADRDKDLTNLFVRDLDDIQLPSRDRWRPAPRKESQLMKSSRYVLSAAAIAAVLVVVLIASFELRGSNPVAASPSPTASLTPSPTATASPTVSPAATVSTGAITGTFSYPSDFIPALTVYAISVNDPKVFFFVDFAGYGNPPRPTLPPGVSQPIYTLSGIVPGTYYVIAYRNDGVVDSPGVAGYSQYVVKCIQATTGGQNSTPAPGCSQGDHSLIPVTVGASETVSRIDIKDWNPSPPSSYPARPAGSAPVDQCGVIDEAFLGDPPSGGYVTIAGVKYLVQGLNRNVALTGRLVPGATACARGTGIRTSPGVIDMRTGSVTAAP